MTASCGDTDVPAPRCTDPRRSARTETIENNHRGVSTVVERERPGTWPAATVSGPVHDDYLVVRREIGGDWLDGLRVAIEARPDEYDRPRAAYFDVKLADRRVDRL